MQPTQLSPPGDPARRAEELFAAHRDATYVRTDRMFAVLIGVEWIAAIAIAIIWSPYGWAGKVHTIHAHVFAAVGLGGAISSLPETAIVEVPTLVDRAGLQPTVIGELPPQLVGYVHPHVVHARAARAGPLPSAGGHRGRFQNKTSSSR